MTLSSSVRKRVKPIRASVCSCSPISIAVMIWRFLSLRMSELFAEVVHWYSFCSLMPSFCSLRPGISQRIIIGLGLARLLLIEGSSTGVLSQHIVGWPPDL